MSINRIQKLLFSEYCDFEDMVLVESPFAETTRDGKGLRQVHLGLTPSKLVLATDILPLAKDSTVIYIPGIDPDIETLELVAVYPIECVNLSVFHRRKRQSLKARFCNNKIQYFELGGFEKRNMFWNLWCEKVKYLNPENPNSSHSETSVGTMTTNSTLYLISSKRFLNPFGNSQIWCKYATVDSAKTSPQWTDKYLYLGKNLDESPLKYRPKYMPPTIEDFFKKNEDKRSITVPASENVQHKRSNQINRFSTGVEENCITGLFLPAEGVLINEKFSNSSAETADRGILELAEDAVRLWELYKKQSSSATTRSRHRRRFAISPQPLFFHGLGPWNVNYGEKYSLQMKRAASVVTIKRQPINPELRLSVSKRQLVASISCNALHADEKLISFSNNTIRLPPKRPVIFFWTPEYWYRPRSAKDAYQELQSHLKKIREYHQIKHTYRSKNVNRNKFGNNSESSSDNDNSSNIFNRKKRSMFSRIKPVSRKITVFSEKDNGDIHSKETSLQYLKRILRMEVDLTAWDFDSNTLAFQLTLIDKELFLKITPPELGILVWQQSSKNAPNIGAMVAFSHRISCLVVSEILKDDSEKIRARLVARFINTADKCYKISNFQSCRSVLCGLQSPPIYRLYSMWTYIRKRHSAKYEIFEKLCRLYRDPRLWVYQNKFQSAIKNPPYLPFVGDIIEKLLNRIPDYQTVTTTTTDLGIKISVKQKPAEMPKDDPKKEVPSLLRKILSTLKNKQLVEKDSINSIETTTETVVNYRQHKSLCDYYKPLDQYEDNRLKCLNECVSLLERYQKAATCYVYTRNELAREYLLKARYREDKENFIQSFNIQPRAYNS